METLKLVESFLWNNGQELRQLRQDGQHDAYISNGFLAFFGLTPEVHACYRLELSDAPLPDYLELKIAYRNNEFRFRPNNFWDLTPEFKFDLQGTLYNRLVAGAGTYSIFAKITELGWLSENAIWTLGYWHALQWVLTHPPIPFYADGWVSAQKTPLAQIPLEDLKLLEYEPPQQDDQDDQDDQDQEVEPEAPEAPLTSAINAKRNEGKKIYYYRSGDQVNGPLSRSDLKELRESGKIEDATAIVRKDVKHCIRYDALPDDNAAVIPFRVRPLPLEAPAQPTFLPVAPRFFASFLAKNKIDSAGLKFVVSLFFILLFSVVGFSGVYVVAVKYCGVNPNVAKTVSFIGLFSVIFRHYLTASGKILWIICKGGFSAGAALLSEIFDGATFLETLGTLMKIAAAILFFLILSGGFKGAFPGRTTTAAQTPDRAAEWGYAQDAVHKMDSGEFNEITPRERKGFERSYGITVDDLKQSGDALNGR